MMVSWALAGVAATAATQSILSKWREQGEFIRFVDGNARNAAVSNMQFVTLRDAMRHVDDWKVDWDMELTQAECALVRSADWRAGLVFG